MGEIVEVQVFVEPGAHAPVQATPGAAGLDLCAHIDVPCVMQPGVRALVATGLRVAIPAGYEGQVRPRSGLALNHGITVLNAPGTIDSDFRGYLGVLLMNLGAEDFTIKPGMRIAQLVIAPVPQVRLAVVDSVEALGVTARGAGGFGSTGMGEIGAVPLGAPASDSVDGQLGLFERVADRGPMEV